VSNKSKRRTPRPRKKLNLGITTREVTFYIVRFLAKVPAELREGTDAPEWIKRDSPPTLNEGEAIDAYETVLEQLDQLGLRSPQLLVRTVTEDVLRDYDVERGAAMSDAMQEHLDAANAEADAQGDEVDTVLDALAGVEATP
jgi:hypothetical protein